MKVLSKSLKVKISLWYTLFLLIVSALLFVLAFETHRFQEKSSIEKTLVEVVADTAEHVEIIDGTVTYDDDMDFYSKNVYISIYENDGDLLFGRRPIVIRNYPDLRDKETFTVDSDNNDRWFIYDSKFVLDDNTIIWIRGITDEGAAAIADNNVVTLMLILLPLIIIVAFCGGLLVTTRGFRPIMEIVDTANEIRESGNLSKRIRPSNDDKELIAVTESVNKMLESLENLVSQEKQFTSDVSHELRTPIAIIKAQSELAINNHEDHDYALKSINSQSVRMQNLLNRLLLLSRSDAGTLMLENERFNFSEILNEIVEQQQLVAAEKGLKITGIIESDVLVCGDELMLMRVVLNLIDNAIKYTKDAGSEITVSLAVKHNNIVCLVQDDGIGISEENLTRIWNRFYRVDESRSDGSAGLGLSMVESIVKTMGGSVTVESEVGKGSCFGILLPIVDGEAGCV